MAKTTLQRLVDAGVEFSDISRKQAESIVQSMVKAGEVGVTTPRRRCRHSSTVVVRPPRTCRREFSKQMTWLSERFDELEDRFEELAEKIAERVKAEMNSAAPAKKAPAKKTAAKKAPAKKTRCEEGSGQEDGCEEGSGQEDGCEEGSGQEGRGSEHPRRLIILWRLVDDSTPNSFGAS